MMTASGLMMLFFSLLTHLIIIFGIFALIYAIGLMIRHEANTLEKAIRISAALTGFLIYLSTRIFNISIPYFAIISVSITNPIMFGIINIFIPSASGCVLAWYSIHCINRCEDTASRILILISSFIVVMFGDVYAALFQKMGLGDPETVRMLTPNLTFIIAISLYFIFKYKHKKPKS